MNSKISDKDKKDWEEFLYSDESLPNKDAIIKNQKQKKIKTFDLHGYSLSDANEKIKDLIYDAYKNEVYKLIIVTGKGLHSNNEQDPYVSKEFGILKNSIPEFISSNKNLSEKIYKIKKATPKDGGDGAIHIFLKKTKE